MLVLAVVWPAIQAAEEEEQLYQQVGLTCHVPMIAGGDLKIRAGAYGHDCGFKCV